MRFALELDRRPRGNDRTRFVLIVGLAAVAASITGCGARQPATFRVAGIVRDAVGDPVERAMITLLSVGEGVKYRAEGVVGPAGRFSLTTFRPDDGAVAGLHRVILVPLPSPDGQSQAAASIPARYEHPERSGLTVEIEPQPVNEIILVVERP